MEFDNKLPEWKNEGGEPSEKLKTGGFPARYKPPASIMNWLFSAFSKAITEIQTKLSKVDNTADSEKSVKFASEAGVGRKVQYPLTVRFKGGDTEGTDKWTFDGSTSRSVNITPDKIGASATGHTHTLNGISETSGRKNKYHAVAIRGADTTNALGQIVCNYSATIEGLTELYNGIEVTIIPDSDSKFTVDTSVPEDERQTLNHITLNINGLGAIPVRRPLSTNTFTAQTPKTNSFIKKDTPCRLIYHQSYTNGGIWLTADRLFTSAQDLYGTTPITSGGTGATNAEQARKNLGIPNVAIISYTGTGTSGESGACSVTLPFVPRMLMMLCCVGQKINDDNIHCRPISYYNSRAFDTILCESMPTTYTKGWGFYAPQIGSSTFHTPYGKKSYDGKTISWYVEEQSQSIWEQCNQSGFEYYILAVE